MSCSELLRVAHLFILLIYCSSVEHLLMSCSFTHRLLFLLNTEQGATHYQSNTHSQEGAHNAAGRTVNPNIYYQ